MAIMSEVGIGAGVLGGKVLLGRFSMSATTLSGEERSEGGGGSVDWGLVFEMLFQSRNSEKECVILVAETIAEGGYSFDCGVYRLKVTFKNSRRIRLGIHPGGVSCDLLIQCFNTGFYVVEGSCDDFSYWLDGFRRGSSSVCSRRFGSGAATGCLNLGKNSNQGTTGEGRLS